MTAGSGRVRRAAPWLAPLLAGSLLAACQTGGGLGRLGDGLDPQVLIGMTPQQVGAVLGEPELRRVESPAEIWQYRTEDCVLDLYLFGEAGRSEVVHVDTRLRSDGRVSAPGCLGGVVAQARGSRIG